MKSPCGGYCCSAAPPSSGAPVPGDDMNSREPSGQNQVAAVGAVRAVLRAVADDRDFGAGLHGVAREAAAQQRVRRRAFDHPRRRRAVVVLDVDVQPGVRIDPLHLRDRASNVTGWAASNSAANEWCAAAGRAGAHESRAPATCADVAARASSARPRPRPSALRRVRSRGCCAGHSCLRGTRIRTARLRPGA